MLNLNQKAWWRNQAKVDSRLKGIHQARMLFGNKLPENLQWWSMCGQCADEKGDWRGSEPHQLVASGFIEPRQFWGVELNADILAHNKENVHNSYWRCGDVNEVMRVASVKKTKSGRSAWRPGVINLDTTMMPAAAGNMLARTMLHVSETVTHEVLVILNMVVRHRHQVGTTADLIEALTSNSSAQHAMAVADWSTNWSEAATPQYRSVDETGAVRTLMQTHYFTKGAR